MIFWLIVGHAVADFVLQSDTMARGKAKAVEFPPASGKFPPWYYWLGAHALTHGGAVALVTGSVFLGMLETVLHAVIDLGKIRGRYGIHTDQALHILCKLIYVGTFWHSL